MAEMEKTLKAERDQRSAIEKEYAILRRQIELKTNATTKPTDTQGTPATMQTGGVMMPGYDNPIRTTLGSMASNNAPNKSASTVFGALLGGGVVPGEKRKLEETRTKPAPGTTAATTTGTLGSEASATPAAKRHRSLYLYQVPEKSTGFDRVRGSLVSSARSVAASSPSLASWSMNIRNQFRASGGATRGLLSGVETFGTGLDVTTNTTAPHLRGQPSGGSPNYYGGGGRN